MYLTEFKVDGAIRSSVGKNISVEVCHGDNMKVLTKRYENHFRIASVCPHCERRRLWIFSADGKLIKLTN